MTTCISSPPRSSRPARSRDPHLDLVRAACIAVVVLWHWVFTTVDWQADGPHVGNPIPTIPFGWLLTWFVQPMPLFFLVGGHLHRRSLEARTGAGGAWVRSRLGALVVPVLPLLGLFVAGYLAVGALLPGRGFERALILVISPLWFLAVYAVCVVVAPAGLALHRRHPMAAPAILLTVAGLLDALRFSGHGGWWSWLSMIAVWALVHQLGLAAWDVVHASRRTAVGAATAGYAVLAIAVTVGPYAAEMVGVPGKPSNFSPATVVIAALAFAQLGVVALVRERIDRLVAGRPAALQLIEQANRSAMPIFAWHLPAWGLAFGVLSMASFPIPAEPTMLWWLTRPVWLVVPALALAPALARRSSARSAPVATAAVTAVAPQR